MMAFNDTTFPRLVPPTTVAKVVKPTGLFLVPHDQVANMMALIAQAVATELPNTHNSVGPIPPAPQPRFKRRELESSSTTPARGVAPKRQICSIPMEEGEIPQPVTMRGLPVKPPDRDQRNNE